MNNRFLSLLFFWLSSLFLFCTAKENDKNPIIRVLLDEIKSPSNCTIDLHAPHGFYLWQKKEKKPIKINETTLQIEGKNGKLFLHRLHENQKKESTKEFLSLHITACKHHPITINGKQYVGACTVIVDQEKKRYYVVNNLPLEEYVYAVLVCESYAHWPLEMQKVQAVATRTFAQYYMRKAHKNKEYFDVRNSIFHQRYDGTHQYDHLRKATTQTASEILVYKNKIALTMFDACCGGIIPSKLDTIDFSEAPYLKRSKICTFCKNFSLYRWKHIASLKELNKKLLIDKSTKKEILRLSPLTKISVAKTDKAGSVSEIKCEGKKASIILPTHKIKNSLGKGLKSKFFTLEQKNDQLIFNGKGFGHGLGLCQHGARAMVDQGYSYKKILAFYFPRTKILPFFKIKKD
jgi:stage II sporulation protein D